MELFDFDKSASEYVKKWYEGNAGKYSGAELTDEALKALEEWKKLPLKELSGKSPVQFFADCADGMLVTLLECYLSEKNAPAALLDEIKERKSKVIEDLLLEKIRDGLAGKLTETAMKLLHERESKKTIPIYTAWLFDEKIDGGLAALAAVYLNDAAERDDYRKIDAKLPGLSDALKPRLSDFVVYAPSTENGFKLLLDLFLTDTENMPLYASYLGMYGIESAVPHLVEAAKDCNYVSFMEIRNAVERLGGEFEVKRDFSSDADYIKLKN